jgi:hypothetical protein
MLRYIHVSYQNAFKKVSDEIVFMATLLLSCQCLLDQAATVKKVLLRSLKENSSTISQSGV